MANAISPLHRAWRMLPAGPRRALLRQGTALLAPRPDRVAAAAQGGVAVGGELARASGLGEGARLMLAALETLGVAHWAVDVGSLTQRAEQAVPVLPAGVPIVLHVNAPELPAALLRLPRAYLRGRRVIGYWAWELPVVPPSWRIGAEFVHEVWMPSRFAADAVAPIAEVRVVPHPLAAVPPVASRLDRVAFGLPAAAVVTLVSFNLASSFVRKNPLAAIAAHRAAFGDRADRVLVVKTGEPGAFAGDFAQLRAAAAGAANIRIETREFPPADRHALTACADIVLSLHRSEGFGLVPAEAMLLGRPVIATGWSGTLEFMDATSAALVDFTLVPARDPRGVFEAPGAVWAEPDIGVAAARLAWLADDAEARAALGARGRAMATERLGTAKLAQALAAIGL